MEELELGSFYEIDHTKFHQHSPVQLTSIRVIMVTEKNYKKKRVTVRFPSLSSLKSHFGSHGRTRALINSSKLLTLLDEKYVMKAHIARAVLHRKVKSESESEEWSKHRQSWSFWSSMTTEEIIQEKGRGCQHKLKTELYEEEEEINEARKKSDEVEKESESESDDERIKQRKRKRKLVKIETKKPRWSEERFKQAEEFMLQVMKAKGAVAGNPIMRFELRNEAKKLIGDTGLVDHLLKHFARRVAPGGGERFRRRHNPEGAMEYWLETDKLVPGDNPTQDPIEPDASSWVPTKDSSRHGTVVIATICSDRNILIMTDSQLTYEYKDENGQPRFYKTFNNKKLFPIKNFKQVLSGCGQWLFVKAVVRAYRNACESNIFEEGFALLQKVYREILESYWSSSLEMFEEAIDTQLLLVGYDRQKLPMIGTVIAEPMDDNGPIKYNVRTYEDTAVIGSGREYANKVLLIRKREKLASSDFERNSPLLKNAVLNAMKEDEYCGGRITRGRLRANGSDPVCEHRFVKKKVAKKILETWTASSILEAMGEGTKKTVFEDEDKEDEPVKKGKRDADEVVSKVSGASGHAVRFLSDDEVRRSLVEHFSSCGEVSGTAIRLPMTTRDADEVVSKVANVKKQKLDITTLSDDEVRRSLVEHFSSCGEVSGTAIRLPMDRETNSLKQPCDSDGGGHSSLLVPAICNQARKIRVVPVDCPFSVPSAPRQVDSRIRKRHGLKDYTKTVAVRGLDCSSPGLRKPKSVLMETFGKCGEISRVYVPYSRYTQRGVGVGYVEFSSADGFKKALELNGIELGDRDLGVLTREASPVRGPFAGGDNGRFGDSCRGGRGTPVKPWAFTFGTGKRTVFHD